MINLTVYTIPTMVEHGCGYEIHYEGLQLGLRDDHIFSKQNELFESLAPYMFVFRMRKLETL